MSGDDAVDASDRFCCDCDDTDSFCDVDGASDVNVVSRDVEGPYISRS